MPLNPSRPLTSHAPGPALRVTVDQGLHLKHVGMADASRCGPVTSIRPAATASGQLW